jgi:hypothetical protein
MSFYLFSFCPKPFRVKKQLRVRTAAVKGESISRQIARSAKAPYAMLLFMVLHSALAWREDRAF